MFDEAVNLARSGLVWLMRRGAIFFFSLVFSLSLPKKMWTSVAEHREGVEFFSDPIGKPSLFTYWRTLAEMSYSTLFLRSKRPTAEGFAAANNGPSSDWSDDGVTVLDKGNYMEFTPPDGFVTGGAGQPVGVILLPGALVSPLAYAPLARTMASKGYPSFIVRFGFNLANFEWERIGEVVAPTEPKAENCPATPTKWVLAGHSLGSLAMEKYYPGNSAHVGGLVYLGSGNRIGDVLSGVDVPALVVRGSRDPFCPAEAMKASSHKLPKGAVTVVAEGGNHRGFASYSWQPLDWEATITQQEQRHIVVEYLVDFIKQRVEK